MSYKVFFYNSNSTALALECDFDAPMIFETVKVKETKEFTRGMIGKVGFYYDDSTGDMKESIISDYRVVEGRFDVTDEFKSLSAERE